jgi:hypothetical protein
MMDAADGIFRKQTEQADEDAEGEFVRRTMSASRDLRSLQRGLPRGAREPVGEASHQSSKARTRFDLNGWDGRWKNR